MTQQLSQLVDKDQAKDGDLYFDGDKLCGKGVVRTEESCSNCHKLMIFTVNFDLNGDHVVVCPHCGHQHCRIIKDGVVTGDRWSSRSESVEVPKDSIWDNTNIGAKSVAAYQHIREKWFG